MAVDDPTTSYASALRFQDTADLGRNRGPAAESDFNAPEWQLSLTAGPQVDSIARPAQRPQSRHEGDAKVRSLVPHRGLNAAASVVWVPPRLDP